MKSLVVTLLIIGVLQVAYLALWPTDSTDISKWRRSGMGVYTDNATGVQYVKVGFFGSLTPRLNADGTHFNVKE